MRGPTPEEILNTPPPALRKGSGSTQAHLDMRRRILLGEYKPGQLLIPKDIEKEYHVNNNGVQALLLRLALEGLVHVFPVKERTWPNNAAINEYRVADLNVRHRMFSTRQGVFVSDISQQGYPASQETLELKVKHADKELASLLDIEEGDNVVFHRTLQKRDPKTVVAIADTYFPFWFAEFMPELEKSDVDVLKLMVQRGRKPAWCTETVDIVQATSVERELFELSTDDPTPLLKILRRTFDNDGKPLYLDFLSDRGDIYRLHYSFPLFAEEVPEKLRDK